MRYSQIVKRFTLAALIAFSGAMLTGCGEDIAAKEAKKAAEKKAKGDAMIAKVKKSAYPIDKSRTLEQAVNSKLKDVQWTTSDIYGSWFVTVTGTWNDKTVKTSKREDGYDRRIGYTITENTFCNPGNKITIKFEVKDEQTVNFYELKVESDKQDLGGAYEYEVRGKKVRETSNLVNSLSYDDERILALFE